MDTDQDAGTVTATPTRPPAIDQPKALPRGRRPGGVAGSLTRGLLVFMLVVTAPLALMVWATTPRITSPTQLASQGVRIGLTEIVRRDIVDQLSSELADRRQSPTESAQVRSVFERSMTQAWFDEQVMSVATELEEWLAGTDPQPPELVVDLRPVK
jgi:hypothetical protein